MAERPRTLASRRHWLLQVVVATSGSRQTVAAISYRFPSSSLLGSVRMVDSSAVMGHDALQQPSWPQAQRRASHRRHDGSQGDMVHISSCCFLSAPSWPSTGWALLKSRRLSKRLSFASSSFQRQRLSSERTQVWPSFRKALTGRNGTRVLHRLGACFMVPGIDYPRYVHLGALMPRQSDFDSICKLCARKGSEVAQGDSDVTQTSSSSEAGQ